MSIFPQTNLMATLPSATFWYDAYKQSLGEICGFRTILTGANLNNLINYFRNKYDL